MRSPAPVLLLVAPLLACFADNGGRSSAGSITASGSSSGESDTGGTETSANETSAPTTEAPTIDTTTNETTDATTVMGSTGAVDNCAMAPECEAGAVEDGPLCDPCGVQRRTCQLDCTWSPMICEQVPDTCEYWVLTGKEKGWERVPRDPEATFAPETTVLAAIALVPQKQIYVLTADTYHVFSTPTRTWTEAGARETIFPQLAGVPVFHATGLSTEPPDTIVTIVAGKESFSYTFVGAQNKFAFVAQQPCCGADWMSPNAPPSPFMVRDGWSRLGDPEGWIVGDVQQLCNLDMPTPVYAYNLSIGDGTVYPQDIGHCFDFFPPVAYPEFTPFSFAGAPPTDLIGGAEWLDGLWLFRGE